MFRFVVVYSTSSVNPSQGEALRAVARSGCRVSGNRAAAPPEGRAARVWNLGSMVLFWSFVSQLRPPIKWSRGRALSLSSRPLRSKPRRGSSPSPAHPARPPLLPLQGPAEAWLPPLGAWGRSPLRPSDDPVGQDLLEPRFQFVFQDKGIQAGVLLSQLAALLAG